MTGKPRMAPNPDAPPGFEQDSRGNPIPFEKRTEEDQEKLRRVIADAIDPDKTS